MDARNAVQRIVAILVIVGGACGGDVYASPVYIYSDDFNLPIPAEPNSGKGWMADAIIEVPDHFTVHDIDVSINVTHPNVIDLQIFLKSPGATEICLNMFDIYNLDKFPRDENYKDYTSTIFDDEAKGPVRDANAPFTGRFTPIEPYELSEFDGENAYGFWQLRIYDAFYADTGTLNSLELIITTPEPATAILLALGTGLLGLFKPRRGH